MPNIQASLFCTLSSSTISFCPPTSYPSWHNRICPFKPQCHIFTPSFHSQSVCLSQLLYLVCAAFSHSGLLQSQHQNSPIVEITKTSSELKSLSYPRAEINTRCSHAPRFTHDQVWLGPFGLRAGQTSLPIRWFEKLALSTVGGSGDLSHTPHPSTTLLWPNTRGVCFWGTRQVYIA